MDIYQLTNTTPYQMMCYVINTNNGKVIVIDGGNHGQAEELYRVLNKAGKTVDLWILTHFHSDHFGAIIDLLDKYDDIKIKRFIRNNQTDAVTASLAGEDVADYDEWAEYEKRAALPFEEIKRGDYFISQFICENGHLSAVIDWMTACVHPVIWEIMRSFVYGAACCADGEIDNQLLKRYIDAYCSYGTLNDYDMENIYKLYFYQIAVCDYYGQYYASRAKNRNIYLKQAQFATKLLKNNTER